MKTKRYAEGKEVEIEERSTKSPRLKEEELAKGPMDYATLGARARATPPSETKAEDKDKDKEPDSVAGVGARNLAFEKDETPAPVKKAMKVAEKAPAPKKEEAPKKEVKSEKVGAGYEGVTKKLREKEDEEKYGKSKRLKAISETFNPPKERKSIETRETTSSKMRDTGKSERLKAIVGSFKSGGKVSSASSRADGIAQRGKTRGRMV